MSMFNKLNPFAKKRTRSTTSGTSSATPSASSSRRHSVSGSPQPMDEDVAERRRDSLLLGGMRDPRGASMRFTPPHGQPGVPPLPPRRATRSSTPPPYEPKLTMYGFTVYSEEELKLQSLEGRIMENASFHDETLKMLGFYSDIYRLLANIGWKNFVLGDSVNHRIDLALEMLLTLKNEKRIINARGDEAWFLSFRIKDQRQHISYASVSKLLHFDEDAPEQLEVEARELEEFWQKIGIGKKHTRQGICNVVLQIFHTWMSKRILGRMKEGKITELELKWMYAALEKKQKIDPSYIMMNRWVEEASSGSGKIGMACYLTSIAYSLVPDIGLNVRFFVQGTEMDAKFLVQGKYISRNEKKGYKILGTDISLPDSRLRLFMRRRRTWNDTSIMVQMRSEKRKMEAGSSSKTAEAAAEEEDEEEEQDDGQWTQPRSVPSESAWRDASAEAWGITPTYQQPSQEYVPSYVQQPFIPDPYMGRAPDQSFGAQYAHLPQPQRSAQIFSAYANRTLEDNQEIQRRTQRVDEGIFAMTYHFGQLGVVPPQDFDGGAVQDSFNQEYEEYRRNQAGSSGGHGEE